MSIPRPSIGATIRARIDTGFATSLSRRVGGGVLVGAGLLNAALAVALFSVLGSESAFLTLLDLLDTWWAESHLLERGGTLRFAVGTVAPVLGAFVLAVGLLQVGAGLAAVFARGYRVAIAAALLGAVTIVTLPLCVVAAFLCWASREHFDGSWSDSFPTRQIG